MMTKTATTRAGRVAGAQTISRALDVIDVLRKATREVGLTEIARELLLHTSTVHRILRALAGAGCAVQSRETPADM